MRERERDKERQRDREIERERERERERDRDVSSVAVAPGGRERERDRERCIFSSSGHRGEAHTSSRNRLSLKCSTEMTPIHLPVAVLSTSSHYLFFYLSLSLSNFLSPSLDLSLSHR